MRDLVWRRSGSERSGYRAASRTGRVTGFEEKPEHPVSDLVNAGMYAFHPAVLDEIGSALPQDIGYHLLPRLVGRAFAVPVECYFRDIGTIDAYQQAREEWPALASR